MLFDKSYVFKVFYTYLIEIRDETSEILGGYEKSKAKGEQGW